MNRTRLEAVRDALRKLPPPEDPKATAVKEAAPGWHETGFDFDNPIDTFDMDCYHITEEHPEHGCRTRGCIAGIAIDLSPMEAAEITKRTARKHDYPAELNEIAQEILGLDSKQADNLFGLFGEGPCLDEETIGTVTPEEAAVAVENLLAGNDPRTIWDHVGNHQRDTLREADTGRPAPPGPTTA